MLFSAYFQAEVTALREENVRLVSLVRSQYGPAADALITPITHSLTALSMSHSNFCGMSCGSIDV